MIKQFFYDKHRKPYIIAEVSQNHDGSLGQAHAYIDAVADCGADAIKFQTHIAEEESTILEPFRVKFSYEDRTRYDYWKRMEFTPEQWKGLYNHAIERGLDFLSSPFSIKALKMLDDIGIPAWKFGSGEIFNDVLFKKALETKKPIIISTGLSTIGDIDQYIEKIKSSGNEFIIMHCTTAYPTKPEQIDLNMIQTLQNKYGMNIGLSDHSATIYPSLSAITLGARVIEVHVTMSKYMFGPDVKASVTLEQLKQIVEGSEYIHIMLENKGTRDKLSKSAQELKLMFSKSIYIKKELQPGDIITEENLAIKKPYIGLDSAEYYSVIGKKVNKHLNKDDPLFLEYISE